MGYKVKTLNFLILKLKYKSQNPAHHIVKVSPVNVSLKTNYKQYAKHLNTKDYKFVKKNMHFPHAPLSEGHIYLHMNEKSQRDIK